jgi:uncharacterized protein (DUF58 family)
MLTTRGWNLLIATLALVGVTLALEAHTLTLVGITLLTWLLASWLVFVVRLRLAGPGLRVQRTLLDRYGPVRNLWAQSSFTVRVALVNDSGTPLPYVRVSDRLPVLLELLGGGTEADGAATAAAPLTLEYRVQCAAAGQVRFEGLSVQVADVQGFFYQALFVADVQTRRVLPPLAGIRGRITAAKRHNLLPLLGHHQHARPGTGSELLDLRDYLPGDPPKTIAWKVSARRQKLMTKEFESEVPIRCTLFVDTSDAVRVGVPGRNALARLVEIAAMVAQATAATRDLTGLCLVGERVTDWVRPARGAHHVIKLMNLLADAAALPQAEVDAPVARLLPLAYALALERYPEALREDVNQVPAWLAWLFPKPAYTVPQPPLRARRVWTRPWVWLRRRLRYLRLRLRQAIVARISAHYRRHYRWRKRLAALMSLHYGLAPGGLALLMEDDKMCSRYLQRFLAEHHVPAPVPLHDGQGRYVFAGGAKIEALARALLRAVARGHDNELYILLVDLLESDDQLGKLLAAVKVALARHHQVMVLCPWPPGLPSPLRRADGADDDSLPAQLAQQLRRGSLMQSLLWRMTAERFNRAYAHLRRSFARLGVPVICAREVESVSLILKRLEHLRGLQRGVR